jgi:hypothetical protein
MTGRKAASRDKQICRIEGKQAAIWNIVGIVPWNVFPARGMIRVKDRVLASYHLSPLS